MEPTYAFLPRYVSGESAWTGHIPFAYDLLRVLQPSLLVELGTWSGDSFFAFYQSVADHALSTRCYAVDHWKGDKQTGPPDDALFSRVQVYCSATYPEFAYLMRMISLLLRANFATRQLTCSTSMACTPTKLYPVISPRGFPRFGREAWSCFMIFASVVAKFTAILVFGSYGMSSRGSTGPSIFLMRTVLGYW